MLHLIAVAHSVGIELTIDDFQSVSDRVPFIADLKPSGKYVFEDVYKIGGIPSTFCIALFATISLVRRWGRGSVQIPLWASLNESLRLGSETFLGDPIRNVCFCLAIGVFKHFLDLTSERGYPSVPSIPLINCVLDPFWPTFQLTTLITITLV